MRSEIFIPVIFLLFLTFSTVARLYCYFYIRDIRGKGIEGYVFSHPYIKNGYQNFQINGISIKTNIFPKYRLGDYLVVVPWKNGNPNSMYYPKITVQESRNISILNWISIYREKLVLNVKRNLPQPYSGLVLGMTIGYKDDFPDDFLDLLKRTGTIHIIVVSGYNVALVVTFISSVFAFVGRRLNLFLAIISVLIFVCLAGFDPPVVRASIMGLIALIGIYSGNSRMSLYILYITLLVMLLVNPTYLIDIGFQLSGIATGAVILASVVTSEDTFISAIFVNTFVNLTIYPVISYYFGTISFISLISNIMILWMVPFVTFSGFLFFVFPTLFVKVFLVSLIDFYIFITNALGSLAFASITYKFSITYMLIYYLILLFVYVFILKWKRYLNDSS